jgi:hypothetical protein
MWYAWGRGDVFTKFGLEGPKGRERPRRRWEDNIKMDLRDRIDGANWIRLAQIGSGGGIL